ncbi:MAG: periplasmic heavy metal sensor [Pseudomonadota bacterium]
MAYSDGAARDRGDWMARPWARWLLIGSLSANLAIAGLYAGAVAGGNMGADEPVPTAGQRGNGERILMLLPDTQKDAWREARAGQAWERRQIHAEMVLSNQEIIEAVRSDSFERALFEASLAERRRLSAALREMRHRTLADVATSMSRDERSMFADRLEQVALRWAEQRGIDPADPIGDIYQEMGDEDPAMVSNPPTTVRAKRAKPGANDPVPEDVTPAADE